MGRNKSLQQTMIERSRSGRAVRGAGNEHEE
jgi:hypothetical protein